MEIRPLSKLSFNANVSSKLQNEIRPLFKTCDSPFAFTDKLKYLKNIGDKASEITFENDNLLLINNTIAPLKKIELPNKGSLLDSFMALTENDIVNAEGALHYII